MDQYFSFSPHLHIQTGVGSKTVPTITLKNLHEEIILNESTEKSQFMSLDKLRNDINEIKISIQN